MRGLSFDPLTHSHRLDQDRGINKPAKMKTEQRIQALINVVRFRIFLLTMIFIALIWCTSTGARPR